MTDSMSRFTAVPGTKLRSAWILFLVIKFIVVGYGEGISIPESVEPVFLENGTSPKVVLDCPYEFNGEEDAMGLVVKWYYNNRPRPVYQWIPTHSPQALGILKNRLDLSYEASEDESKKFRALAIVDPSSELTGNYTCWVTSFGEEENVQVIFTVYTPAQEFNISIEREETNMTVTCLGEGIFPEPTMKLFKTDYYGNEELQETETVTEIDSEEGTYEVIVEKTYDHEELDWENKFRCSLTLPHTDYGLQEELIYYPSASPCLSQSWIWVMAAALTSLLARTS